MKKKYGNYIKSVKNGIGNFFSANMANWSVNSGNRGRI